MTQTTFGWGGRVDLKPIYSVVAEVYTIGALKRFSDRYLDMDHMRTEEISLTWHHSLAQTAAYIPRSH